MPYILHVLIIYCFYLSIAATADLAIGTCGRMIICVAAFHAIGAYSTAILTTRHVMPPLSALIVGVAAASAAALVVAAVARRVHGDYFVIATFAIQVIVTDALLNSSVTRGPLGIPAIPPFSVGPLTVTTLTQWLILSATVCAVLVAMKYFLSHSPFGLLLRGIRDDEIFAKALGRSTNSAKASALLFAAIGASVAGSLYAHYFGFVDPSSFVASESVFILAIIIVGGADSLMGPVLGAALLLIIPEILRFLVVSATFSATLRQIVFGLAIIFTTLWRPAGLAGKVRV